MDFKIMTVVVLGLVCVAIVMGQGNSRQSENEPVEPFEVWAQWLNSTTRAQSESAVEARQRLHQKIQMGLAVSDRAILSVITCSIAAERADASRLSILPKFEATLALLDDLTEKISGNSELVRKLGWIRLELLVEIGDEKKARPALEVNAKASAKKLVELQLENLKANVLLGRYAIKEKDILGADRYLTIAASIPWYKAVGDASEYADQMRYWHIQSLMGLIEIRSGDAKALKELEDRIDPAMIEHVQFAIKKAKELPPMRGSRSPS